MKKSWFKQVQFIWLAFILAAVIWAVMNVILQVYPFGDQTVMRVDLYHQYGPFHEELRDRLLNGKSLLYSWEGGMGKQFLSQMAYYTTSPISFLILLFPQINMEEAMALFILIKIAFSAAFMATYLKCAFNKNDFSITAFALMYSFMAFMTSYYWNIMWLDAVAVFPLVALGIDKLIKEDKHVLYCLSLAFVIIVNFYIAFLVCVFASMYFIVVLFSNCDVSNQKDFIKRRIFKFAIISLIAGGISMFLTIPAAITLSNTAASDSTFPKMEIYQNIWQLLTNHFIGARPVILARNEDLPNVYSGLLTIMLLPMFFLNKNIHKKEKILFGIFIGLMLAFCCVKPLDYMIHGFHFPSNLPHRFSFIYSFTIIIMAYKTFVNLKYVDFKHIFIIYAIYILVVLTTEYIIDPINLDIEKVLSGGEIIANAIVMLVYIFILNTFNNAKENEKKVVTFILLICVVAETSFSAYNGFSYLGTTSREAYVKYYEYTAENFNDVYPDTAVEYINSQEPENSFYRTDFRRFTTINDSALYHYKGYSQFSSMAYGGTSLLMQDVGMAATSNSYRYYDPTPLLDAIFNIKYIMNKEAPIANTPYQQVAVFPPSGATYPDEIGKPVYVYKNDKALPLGFMVDSEIENWNSYTKENKDDKLLPFDTQNDFVKKSGAGDYVLERLDVSKFEVENIDTNGDDNAFADGEYNYKLTNPNDLSLIPAVKAEINIPTTKRVYFYVDSGNTARVKFEVKDKDGNVVKGLEDRELSAGRSTFDVGIVPEGSILYVNFTLDRKGEHEKTYRKTGIVKLSAATFDYNKFNEVYENLSKNPYEIEKYTDTTINGKVTAEKDGIMFTSIPYDKGWTVRVDGEKTDLVSIGNDGFIGVRIPEGTHQVDFDYMPQGFIMGIGVTVISIIAFIIFTLFTKNKQIPLPEPEPIVIKKIGKSKKRRK